MMLTEIWIYLPSLACNSSLTGCFLKSLWFLVSTSFSGKLPCFNTLKRLIIQVRGLEFHEVLFFPFCHWDILTLLTFGVV